MIRALSADQITELVLHVVGKVWRVGNINPALCGRQLQFVGFGLSGLIFRNRSGLGHRLEHLIAARARCLEIMERIVAIRTANQTSQKGRFGQGQVRYIFVEVSVGSFAETVDRKTRLLAQVSLIAVERKDFLF